MTSWVTKHSVHMRNIYNNDQLHFAFICYCNRRAPTMYVATISSFSNSYKLAGCAKHLLKAVKAYAFLMQLLVFMNLQLLLTSL